MPKRTTLPRHWALGLGLVVVFWLASWNRWGWLGEYSFFPLWLGYILVVDALVAWRTGTSMLLRQMRGWLFLFLLSAPVWWIFEFHNYFLLNWRYIVPHQPTFWEMLIVGSVNFSTVIPAMFETQQLVASFQFIERFQNRRPIPIRPGHLWALMYGGVFLFAGVLFLPRYFFPFTWVWLFLFTDALNFLRGRTSLIEQASRGDWRTIVALALASLVCGFFWEMWNIRALPKWYYTIPFFDFGKIFEMPLLGYGGYIPFAWELFSLYQLVRGVLARAFP